MFLLQILQNSFRSLSDMDEDLLSTLAEKIEDTYFTLNRVKNKIQKTGLVCHLCSQFFTSSPSFFGHIVTKHQGWFQSTRNNISMEETSACYDSSTENGDNSCSTANSDASSNGERYKSCLTNFDADSVISGLQSTNSKLMEQVHRLTAELATKSQEIENFRESHKFRPKNDSEQAVLQNNTNILKNLLRIDNLTDTNDLNKQTNHTRLENQKNHQKHVKYTKLQQNSEQNIEKLKKTTEKLNKTNQKLIYSNNQVQKLTSQLAKYETRNNQLTNYLDQTTFEGMGPSFETQLETELKPENNPEMTCLYCLKEIKIEEYKTERYSLCMHYFNEHPDKLEFTCCKTEIRKRSGNEKTRNAKAKNAAKNDKLKNGKSQNVEIINGAKFEYRNTSHNGFEIGPKSDNNAVKIHIDDHRKVQKNFNKKTKKCHKFIWCDSCENKSKLYSEEDFYIHFFHDHCKLT